MPGVCLTPQAQGGWPASPRLADLYVPVCVFRTLGDIDTNPYVLIFQYTEPGAYAIVACFNWDIPPT